MKTLNLTFDYDFAAALEITQHGILPKDSAQYKLERDIWSRSLSLTKELSSARQGVHLRPCKTAVLFPRCYNLADETRRMYSSKGVHLRATLSLYCFKGVAESHRD